MFISSITLFQMQWCARTSTCACIYICVEGIAWVNKSSCVNFIFSVRTIPTIKICGRHSLWKSTWLLRQSNWIYDYVLQGINNVPHIVQTFSLTYQELWHSVNFSHCQFCIYCHPLYSKFTTWKFCYNIS